MMRRIMSAAAVMVAGWISTVPAIAAERNLPINAFFGSYSGGGIAQNSDSVFFAITERDLDVVIRPLGKGFRIDWTSVIRGGGDPDKPTVRRKQTTKILQPSGTESVFHGTQSGNPLDGKELCWARIDGKTLTVFLMSVNKAGIYELQQYDRTLSDGRMTLLFRSWRDGDRMRSVTADLVARQN